VRLIAIRLDMLEHRFEYLDRDVLKAIGSESRPVEVRPRVVVSASCGAGRV
jgi:hypothetical protein